MNKQSNKKIHRPPVVVVMGHIDHGKSKLLDYIRKTNVVEKEAGGITQHIGAYEAEVKCDTTHPHKTRKITFLDTPGHEAFSKMRARGAKIADIAILVIAADEGVKPQTLEAYEAIKNSGIPFVVAFNKIDKPNANPDQIKNQLTEHQIFIEGYGGNIPSANISAKTGEGIDDLLDLVLLLTEMENLKVNPEENASGIIIESHLDSKRGVSATLLIQNGIMKKGMFVVSGSAIAPIRIFENFKSKPIEEANFSMPVKIIGFNKMPEVGEEFRTFETKSEAEADRKETSESKKTPSVSLSTLGVKKNSGDEKAEGKDKITIPVIIKADTKGSAEALEKEIMKLADEEIIINVLREDVGNIKEDDIKLIADTKSPIVLGFNVNIDSSAKELAEKFDVSLYLSDIIYKLSEWLEEEIKKRKAQIPREEIIGVVKILKTFSKTKTKHIIGGEVLEGKIVVGKYAKIKRRDSDIGEGKIIELQHKKIKMKEVSKGEQFGAMLETKIEIIKDDIIEIIDKIQ